jgi:hypothetical protein
VPAYKLQLVAGRNLQPSKFTQEFLVNESLVKSLGFKKPGDILNKEISIWGDKIKCPVVGVLKDFNDRSFRNDLAPLLITTNIHMYNQAGIKLATTKFLLHCNLLKQYGSKHFRILFMNTSFLMIKLQVFTNRKTSYRSCIKFLQQSRYSLAVLGCMDWLHSWLYKE